MLYLKKKSSLIFLFLFCSEVNENEEDLKFQKSCTKKTFNFNFFISPCSEVNENEGNLNFFFLKLYY